MVSKPITKDDKIYWSQVIHSSVTNYNKARYYRDNMIRRAARDGMSRKEIALAAGMHRTRIDQIVRGE